MIEVTERSRDGDAGKQQMREHGAHEAAEAAGLGPAVGRYGRRRQRCLYRGTTGSRGRLRSGLWGGCRDRLRRRLLRGGRGRSNRRGRRGLRPGTRRDRLRCNGRSGRLRFRTWRRHGGIRPLGLGVVGCAGHVRLIGSCDGASGRRCVRCWRGPAACRCVCVRRERPVRPLLLASTGQAWRRPGRRWQERSSSRS